MTFVSLAIFIQNFTESTFELWMQTRDEKGQYEGFWEFPGGNIEANESSSKAVIREVQEEVGIHLSEDSLTFFTQFRYCINETEVEFFVYLIKDAKPDSSKGQWFCLEKNNLDASLPVRIPPANEPLIKTLTTALENIAVKDFDLLWTR